MIERARRRADRSPPATGRRCAFSRSSRKGARPMTARDSSPATDRRGRRSVRARMIAPARVAAYDAARGRRPGRADLPAALARARTPLDRRARPRAGRRDRTGTLRVAGRRSTTSSPRLPAGRSRGSTPKSSTILRLSAYQLLHLDRVPASAVVDDAVELHGGRASRARRIRQRGAAARVARAESLPLPPRPPAASDRAAALDYLAVTLSHPRWLAARWLDRYGFDAAERWLRSTTRRAADACAPTRCRTSREALAARSARRRRRDRADRGSRPTG